MNCREFIDFLSAYCEEELDAALHEAFERHVCDCPPCMHYLDGYKKTVQLARGCCKGADADAGGPPSEPRLDPDVPEGLISAILAARAEVDPEPGAGS